MLILSLFLALSCSFDYGGSLDQGEERPDITMVDFDFVRVQDRKPALRLQGDLAQHWDKAERMFVHRARFEQYDKDGGELLSSGIAGYIDIDFSSGDISLGEGVQLYIKEENIVIESGDLRWYDADRILLAPDNQEVLFKNDVGTMLSGRGFGADARRRSWEFVSEARGIYVHKKKEPEQ